MNSKIFLFYLCCFSFSSKFGCAQNSTYLPTVLWHGMGDTCCNPLSMGRIMDLIESELPGIFVHSIQIGNGFLEDTISGFLGNQNEYIQEACDQIAAVGELQGGFNAVGFSQGSQFLRAIVQRCPHLKVKNFVSIGGQHQGIFGFPKCPSMPYDSRICEYIREMLNHEAYTEPIQTRLVQAQYWHDPLDEEAYREGSIFIGEINQEQHINESYRDNLKSLSNFVMVKFLNDSMVIPRESQWFGFYAPGNDSVILPLDQTLLYTEDRLGLKEMDEQGKLKFMALEGDHLEFSDEWFINEIIHVYLS